MAVRTQVIITAAGEARRFGAFTKQMLPINRGDTIIKRSVMQCRLLGYKPIIMVRDAGSQRAFINHTGEKCIIAEDSRTTCNTILSSEKWWADYNIVLLGDVIYSPKTINMIFDCKDDFCVFGDHWELYAFVFNGDNKDRVKKALIKGSKHNMGKVRFMYRAYIGKKLNEKEIVGEPITDHFAYIHDWTRDVDTLQEYKNTMLELVNTHKLEKRYV